MNYLNNIRKNEIMIAIQIISPNILILEVIETIPWRKIITEYHKDILQAKFNEMDMKFVIKSLATQIKSILT